MTIEEMVARLCISETELAKLGNEPLPGLYADLRDYLESQVLQKQNREWAELMGSISAHRQALSTLEARDELYENLKRLLNL